MSEQLQRLQEQNLAYGLVLGSLIQVIWPDSNDRAVARDVLGRIVERMRSDGFGDIGDRQIAGVLAELDGLFQTQGSAASAERFSSH